MTLHRDLLALQVRVDQFKIEEEKEKPFVKQGEGIPDPFGDDNNPSSGALPCNNKLKFIRKSYFLQQPKITYHSVY